MASLEEASTKKHQSVQRLSGKTYTKVAIGFGHAARSLQGRKLPPHTVKDRGAYTTDLGPCIIFSHDLQGIMLEYDIRSPLNYE